jgi:hypothetical protein
MLSTAISDFWHGIFSGKKYPVAFYTKKERQALLAEVKFAAKKYNAQAQSANAGSLSRHFEYINTYISAKNLLPNEKLPENNVMPHFLELLYCGKKPYAFWNYFRIKYKLPLRPSPFVFWDYFDEFQMQRLDIANWLSTRAKGKILDIGGGSHSYIPVEFAIDASSTSLAKNKNAKHKMVFDINKKARLPFESDSFDTIMLNSILAYASNPHKLLAECRRVLRPGGILLITNAPIYPHHPAKYFEKTEISDKALSLWLGTSKFDLKNESIHGTIQIAALKK